MKLFLTCIDYTGHRASPVDVHCLG